VRARLAGATPQEGARHKRQSQTAQLVREIETMLNS